MITNDRILLAMGSDIQALGRYGKPFSDNGWDVVYAGLQAYATDREPSIMIMDDDCGMIIFKLSGTGKKISMFLKSTGPEKFYREVNNAVDGERA